MPHFYITLPSNSSEKFYPNNTLAQFTTKLQTNISLHDEWEVGLAEITFPKNWYTISKNQGIVIDCSGCTSIMPQIHPGELMVNPRRYRRNVNVVPGHYATIVELLEELNKLIQFTFNRPIPEWRRGNIDYMVTTSGRPSFRCSLIKSRSLFLEM